ncbi:MULTISPECIES: hypothetical protein [Cysteiniphilum]|uniref:PAS domain-containing protein n=1 Tax=Cysteiniphilum litorale TaxID=2056700 RepID=A0A8J2Z4X8_9GAMM|nr:MULTISPECIES: hypothetical protein [Cysteiniphilum]WHN66313.1 hypothetical protein NYP54_03525 [Cysteiniphilum sp. QT6929]GGF99795.1 hypothetical protein GCM10010995_16350 [Cysteiniphilum litorale]
MMYNSESYGVISSYVHSDEKDELIAKFAKDMQGRVIACNKAYLHYAGFRKESDLLGKSASQVPLWRDIYEFCLLGEMVVLKSGTKYLNIENFPLPFGGSNIVITEKEPLFIEGRVCGLLGRSKPLLGDAGITIDKNPLGREIITISNRYFHTIELPLKLFKVLIYATWFQLDYKAIAELLFCSESTVKKHFSTLYDYFVLYNKQRNLYELKRIANLFINQVVVDICFDVYKRTKLKRPNYTVKLIFD